MLSLLIIHRTLQLKDDIHLIRLDIIQALNGIVNDLLNCVEETSMFQPKLVDHNNEFLLCHTERRQ